MKKKILLLSLGSVLALSTVAASVILLNNKSADSLEGTDVTYSITINADDVSNSASYESKTVELKTDQLKNPISFTFTNIRRSGDYLEFKGSGDGTFGNADSSAIYAIKHIDIYSYEDNDPNIVKIQWGWKVDSTVEYPYHAYIYNEYPDGMIYRFEEDRPDYFKIVNDDGEGKSVKIKKMIVTYGSECETKTSYGDPYRTINKLKYKKDGDHWMVMGYANSVDPVNDLTFEKTIEGLPVTEIKDYAFYMKGAVHTVDFEDSNIQIVGGYSFYHCSGLTSVNFANSNVTIIDDYAFNACANLTNVTDLTNIHNFGYNAFELCSNWQQDVVFGSQLRDIKGNAFAYSGVTSVTFDDEGNPDVATAAFRWMNNLVSVHIGSEMTKFGDDLSYDDNLATITVGTGNTSFRAIDNVLYYKSGASTWSVWRIAQNRAETSFTLPDDSILTTYCGYGAKTLQTLVLNNNETRIPDYAFNNCTALTSITFGNHANFEINASFRNCSALETLTIPSNVTAIYQHAFEDCTALKTVIFENGCTTLDNQVFYNCTKLEKVLLPTTLSNVGNGTGWSGPADVFDGCTKLRRVLTRLEDGQSYDETDFADGWLGGRDLLTHSDTIVDRDHWRMVDSVPQAWRIEITFIVKKDAGFGNSFYIFGTFNDWEKSEDFIMTYADGEWTFLIELSTFEEIEFKAYCAPTGDCEHPSYYENNNHVWEFDDTAYEYVCTDW